MIGPNPIADRQSAPEALRASPLERCAGLVFGYLFHGGAGTRVNDDTLSHHLGHAHDWTWLHLALADHRARRFLESFGEMPKGARALMLTAEDRVQLHLTATGAYGLLPDIERDFADHSLGSGRLVFWFDGAHLVTARRHPLRAVEQLSDRVVEGEDLKSPAHALARLQEVFTELVEQRLAALGGELGKLEDEVLADRDHVGREALGPLRRELSRKSTGTEARAGLATPASASAAAAGAGRSKKTERASRAAGRKQEPKRRAMQTVTLAAATFCTRDAKGAQRETRRKKAGSQPFRLHCKALTESSFRRVMKTFIIRATWPGRVGCAAVCTRGAPARALACPQCGIKPPK